MTKNNLNAHLSWLVGSSPFVPPTPGPTPLSVESALPFSSGSEDPLHGEPTPVASHPVNRIGHDVVVADLLSASANRQHPANTQIPNNIRNMARLQSGPKSDKKPKLMSQGPLEALRTPRTNHNRPLSSSLRDQYSAPYEKGMFRGVKG